MNILKNKMNKPAHHIEIDDLASVSGCFHLLHDALSIKPKPTLKSRLLALSKMSETKKILDESVKNSDLAGAIKNGRSLGNKDLLSVAKSSYYNEEIINDFGVLRDFASFLDIEKNIALGGITHPANTDFASVLKQDISSIVNRIYQFTGDK